LQDPRRPVDPWRPPDGSWQREISPEELRAPLPGKAAPPARPRAPEQAVVRAEQPVLLGRLWRCAAIRVTKLCARGLVPAQLKPPQPPPEPPPRRWYRIHPLTDTMYFVRPDAGLRGRIPGCWQRSTSLSDDPPLPPEGGPKSSQPVSSRQKQRRRSLPPQVERRLGLPPDSGNSIFDSLCKICYDQPSRAIALPCRHGGMCERCLRRAIISKPLHRGGRSCPLCRRRIGELVRIYDDAVFPQYGYAIGI